MNDLKSKTHGLWPELNNELEFRSCVDRITAIALYGYRNYIASDQIDSFRIARLAARGCESEKSAIASSRH